MSRPPLRVVGEGSDLPPPPGDREAAHAMLDRLLNGGALTIYMQAEYETEGECLWDWETWPVSSAYVATGAVMQSAQWFLPQGDAKEE